MRFELRYTAIRVRDLEKSIAFYTEVLGIPLLRRARVAETKGELAVVGSPESGHRIELNWYADDSPVAGPYREGDEIDHLAFEVEDVDEALAHLARYGHSRVAEVRASRNARWTYVTDPDGVWIEIYEHRTRPAA